MHIAPDFSSNPNCGTHILKHFLTFFYHIVKSSSLWGTLDLLQTVTVKWDLTRYRFQHCIKINFLSPRPTPSPLVTATTVTNKHNLLKASDIRTLQKLRHWHPEDEAQDGASEKPMYQSIQWLIHKTRSKQTQTPAYSRSVEVPIFVHLKGNKPLLQSLSSQSQLVVEVDAVQTEHAEWHGNAQQHDLIFQVLVLLDFLQPPTQTQMHNLVFQILVSMIFCIHPDTKEAWSCHSSPGCPGFSESTKIPRNMILSMKSWYSWIFCIHQDKKSKEKKKKHAPIF